MAAARKGFVSLSILCCYIIVLINSVDGIRTKNKIYIDLKTQSACFRNLNATNQVGCTSDTKGNVGTIHFIRTKSDYEWILLKGTQPPYVAVMDSDDFNGANVRRLYQSGRVNGIMVINTVANFSHFRLPQEGFSSVDACPNDKYGLYSNTTYKDCTNVTWNPTGSSLHFQDIGIPVFALSDPDDVDAVLNKCFFPFNNESMGYPVCAAEMKARMDAAVDSITCMRRSNRFALSLSGALKYCDPLGDKNVIVTMKSLPQNETRENKSVILIGVRLDSTSLFQNEYRAADTTVAGVVTLLATAEALWRVSSDIQKNASAKDIMFAFFQGETFDYIGSSRMVYDMNSNKFPQDYESNSIHLHKIDLNHLDQIVELNQVGRRDDEKSLWMHTDPGNLEVVGQKIKHMATVLKKFALRCNVSLNMVDGWFPLPPASAQRFLRSKSDIPVIVITDHKSSYTNKYYNSRLDIASTIGADYPRNMNESDKYDYVTKQAHLITDLATMLAHYLYNAATGREPSQEIVNKMNASSSIVTHLLYCFMVSPDCELFTESVSADNADSLKKAKQPFPFYVSVNSHTNEVTQLVYNILARFTGQMQHLNQEHCTEDEGDKRFSYVWMQGPINRFKQRNGERVGWCFKSLVHYTDAVSPAFVIDEYNMLSGEYSTWTESRWGTTAIGVRLFLLPSQQFQLLNLCVGILLLLLSLVIVYYISSSMDIVFPAITETQLQS